MVIFGLARLVILAQQIEKLYQELEKYRPPTHAIHFNAHKVLYCRKLSYKHSSSVVY